jgi:hypothetical protein
MGWAQLSLSFISTSRGDTPPLEPPREPGLCWVRLRLRARARVRVTNGIGGEKLRLRLGIRIRVGGWARVSVSASAVWGGEPGMPLCF